VVDTFVFVEPGGLRLHCVGVGVAASALPTLVIVFAALLLRTVIARMPRVHGLLFPSADRLPLALTAIAAAIGGVFAIDWAFAVLGNYGAVTQRVGLALAVFGYLLFAAFLFRPFERGLTWLVSRLPASLKRSGVFLTLLVVIAVVGLSLGRYLEPDYFREVGWPLPASIATVFVASLVGTVAPRWTRYTAGMIAGLALGITAWHYTTQTPPRATSAMRGRGEVTPFFLRLMDRPRPAPALALPEEVQACRPGQELTPVGEIGQVGEMAPDIVLLTIDGWRWDHSSMAEDGEEVTPRIESHSRRGAVFERAYSPAPSTRHSFRTIFSGIIVGRVAAPPTPETRWALSLVEGQPTLASYLRAAGYETIAFLADPGAFPPKEHGLDGFSEIDDRFVPFVRRREYVASYNISHIIARLARPPETGEPPRFLWTHLAEPHYSFTHGPELPTPRRLPYHERHLHSVRYVDQQVDRLLEFLSGRERKDNTWVFITADHGEQFNEHGNQRHGNSVYEEEIHVPLLVWGPGVRAGHRTTPMSLVDVFPTILAAAGLEVPEGICGESFLDALVEGGEPESRPVWAAALPDRTVDIFKYAWIDGDQKLIVDGNTGAREVYDLSEDPGEENNLRDEDEEAGAALIDGLRAYFVEHGLDAADLGLD